MADHIIGPLQVSTPADLKRWRTRELPDDLLRAASLRLGVMSLLFAVLWVVGVTLGHLAAHAIYPNSRRWLEFTLSWFALFGIAFFGILQAGNRETEFLRRIRSDNAISG